MSNKKKRTKPNRQAINTRPVVTKVSAVKRNPLHQWWVDRKQFIRPALPIIGIVLVIVLVVIGIVSLIW